MNLKLSADGLPESWLVRSFKLTIDFSTQQDRSPGEIEPQHQNDQSAQRSVGSVIGVEEMQIESQQERDQQPERHRDDHTRRQPAAPVVRGRQPLAVPL